MKNEKAEALESDGSNKRNKNQFKINQKEGQSMENFNTPRNNFQYRCSFCWRELPNNSVRFNGVGACPACDGLAHLWVKSLRQYAANYFNNLGVRK